MDIARTRTAPSLAHTRGLTLGIVGIVVALGLSVATVAAPASAPSPRPSPGPVVQVER